MATGSRRVGPPASIRSGGPSPGKPGTTFPLPGRPKNQQPPGFEPVTHGTTRESLIVVVSHGGVKERITPRALQVQLHHAGLSALLNEA